MNLVELYQDVILFSYIYNDLGETNARLSVNEISYTLNSSNVDSIGMYTRYRIGNICIVSFDAQLKSAPAVWTDTPIITLNNITAKNTVYSVGRTNSGGVFIMQIAVNSNIVVIRTLNNTPFSANEKTIRGTIIFVAN